MAAPGKPVGIKASATLAEADRSKHILYYALQLFYANGGGRALHRLGRQVQGAGHRARTRRASRPRSTPLEQGRRADADRRSRGAGASPSATSRRWPTPSSSSATTCGPLRDHGRARRRRAVVGARQRSARRQCRTSATTASARATSTTAPPTRPSSRPCSTTRSTRRRSQVTYDEGRHGRAAAQAGRRSTTLNNQLYERAKAAIRAKPLVLPPSAAMAGIYAAGRQRPRACGRRPPTCRSTR